MKEILLQYYAKRNLGDDLFIKIFSEYFYDCKINLITNPKCLPKELGSNVRIHSFSLMTSAIGKIQRLIGWDNKITHKIEKMRKKWLQRLIDKNDAYVYIGGSIFMPKNVGKDEIPFQSDIEPVYEYASCLHGNGHFFVIGANLGPIYDNGYIDGIREALMQYTHVCLRDWSSYSLVKDIQHIQYAPDVIFLETYSKFESTCENVVISVIDIARHCKDSAKIEAYYSLLCNTIEQFSLKQIPVTLVSFCCKEGDEQAIQKIMNMLHGDTSNVSVHCYEGDICATLSVLSGASFIIASRFHSMILGILYGKPVFPISYNSKTSNYLHDLKFEGKYATIATLTETTVEDVMYNYEKQIITDCTLHRKYAKNQFYALRNFLDGK